MKVVWRDVIQRNRRDIVAAATKHPSYPNVIAVLFEIDVARSGESASLVQLVNDTGMKWAVPVNDEVFPKGIVCLSVEIPQLMKTLDEHEETEEIKSKIRVGGSLAVWALVVELLDRQLIDIHTVTPEFN